MTLYLLSCMACNDCLCSAGYPAHTAGLSGGPVMDILIADNIMNIDWSYVNIFVINISGCKVV